MDVVPTRIPKRTAPPNLISGVFLKSVFFLDPELSKFIVAGVFENKGNSLGIVIRTKKSFIYWSYDIFNQLIVHFEKVTEALDTPKNKPHIKLEGGEDIRMYSVYGKLYVALYDGERTVSLNKSEWNQFILSLPAVYTSLRDLFTNEDLIRSFIADLVTTGLTAVPPESLPPVIVNRLIEEVGLYKPSLNEDAAAGLD